MKILVNNTPFEPILEENITSLLHRLKISPNGIAIAINDRVIPKVSWDVHTLHENDRLTIIRAAQGG